jgi:hypothetical protein
MANELKRSNVAAPILERHGKAGELRLVTDVPPWLKDALIDLAEARRVPLKAVVCAALEAYVADEIVVAA